jgi:hypothetical protein
MTQKHTSESRLPIYTFTGTVSGDGGEDELMVAQPFSV